LANEQQLPLVKDLVCSILRACILCRCASESGGAVFVRKVDRKKKKLCLNTGST
jgi:hypothetical protein